MKTMHIDDVLDRAHVVSLPLAVRFRGITTREALLIEGAALWLETRLHAEVPAGDHTVVLLEVTGFADHTDEVAPAALHRNLFHGLRAL